MASDDDDASIMTSPWERTPSPLHDIDANGFGHDDRQKRIDVLAMIRNMNGPLFDKTRRNDGLAMNRAIEAVIGDSTGETPPCTPLRLIDELMLNASFDEYEDLRDSAKDPELRLLAGLVCDNLYKASHAVSQSVASQLGVAATQHGLTMHLSLTKIHGHLLRHLKDGLLRRTSHIWLSQLSIEYDVLREAIEIYLAELGVDQPVQLVVRLPRLGVVLAADSAISSSKEQPLRIVVVDWISLPAGSRWLGLNTTGDQAVRSLHPCTESIEGQPRAGFVSDPASGKAPRKDEAPNGRKDRWLPRELFDDCVESTTLPYLHVYLKSDRKPRRIWSYDKHSECRCYIPHGESVQRCGVEHEYRTGRIETNKPLWFIEQAIRNEVIESATPKPIDPNKPEYIFEMLNNSTLPEIEKLDVEHMSAVAKEALQNVSRLIVVDGDEDLQIDCLDCFQRAIWETGAFAVGRRNRLPRDAMVEEYDGADATRHTRVRRGGPRFIENDPVIDWISLLKCTTIVITPRLKKSYETAKAAEFTDRSPPPYPHPRIPHLDEDITDFVTLMRDTFDPCHYDDKVAAHPLQHCVPYTNRENMPRLNDSDVPMFEEEEAVFLMQGKRPLGSSKLGGTEAETKSYQPARPGLFFNCMFPLEGPIRVNRPENGYRTILVDVDLDVLFANCEVALQLLTRLSSQPWCSITEKESRLFRAMMDTDTPAVDFARSLRFLRTDPQTSIAVFHDVARTAPNPAKMPSFLSVAALAQNPVVGDEVKRKDNIRIFLDACNEHHEPSPDALTVPHFSENDYVVDAQDCVLEHEQVKIDRFIVGSEVGKRLYPLHREDVLEKLDRCRWLARGKQDHLIFYDRPRSLDQDKEETWNGHRHRADYGFMTYSIECREVYQGREEMFSQYRRRVGLLRGPTPYVMPDFGHHDGCYTRILYDEEADAVFRLSGVDDESVPTLRPVRT